MSVFDLKHPLGRDVEAIHTAVSFGLSDKDKKKNPNLKLTYEDPIVSGIGVATLRIANWDNENLTAIYYPFEVDPGDPTWLAVCEDGFAPVRQRIFTRDMLGRRFYPITINGTEVTSPYLQFDVLDDGIVLALDHDGQQVVGYGGYESEVYDVMERLAKRESSIRAVVELAQAA